MYLGMDGGGTKSAFIIIDRAGKIRARHLCGSAYYLEIGMDALQRMIHSGIRAVLEQAGISARDLSYAYFGIPAHGEDNQTPVLEKIPAAALGGVAYACGNDMICGWAGSFACSDGINVIAGTGSICYGQYAGRSARSGGWGELFSDEGSAYWIAHRGLTLFSKMSDGRIDRGPFYDRVREKLAGRPDLELTAYVNEELAKGRSKMASWAPLVRQAAEAGDTAAARIFADAGRELADLVIATRRSLEVPKDTSINVSYSGGVFEAGPLVLAPFETALQETALPFALTAPRFSPTIGAALYAAKLSGEPFSAGALAELASHQGSSTAPIA